MRWLTALVLVLAATAVAATQEVDARLGPWAGRTVADALEDLRARGLPLVFSTRVVEPGLRVVHEPSAEEPREIAREILAPHRLELRAKSYGTLVVVPAPDRSPAPVRGVVRSRESRAPIGAATVRLGDRTMSSAPDGRFALARPPSGGRLHVSAPGFRDHSLSIARIGRSATDDALEVLLEPSPQTFDAIIVTSRSFGSAAEGGFRTRRSDPFASDLETDMAASIRGLAGTGTTEGSARLHSRSGWADEVKVVIDGQELIEPFHLRGFGGPVSAIAPAYLESLELETGAVPPAHGDRMSGVLQMVTREPDATLALELELALDSARTGVSGRWGDRITWLTSHRRGRPDLGEEIDSLARRPVFEDHFAKVSAQTSPSSDLTLRHLAAADEFELEILDNFHPRREEFHLTNRSESLWLNQHAVVGSRWVVDTSISRSTLRRVRNGLDVGNGFLIEDVRGFERWELQHRWRRSLSDSGGLEWGIASRRSTSSVAYSDARLAPEIRREHTDVLESRRQSSWLDLHWLPLDALSLEAGLRFDGPTEVDTGLVSPSLRVGTRWGSTLFRLSWAVLHQPQQPYELQVPDGETRLQPAETTEHRSLSISRPLRSHTLDLEVYDRRVEDPRPRWVNLLEPISLFPEVETDRGRIAPLRSRGRGLEVTLSSPRARRISWRLAYAFSQARDLFPGDGGIESVPRRHDRPHSLRLDVSVRASRRTTLAATWVAHTGEPTTPLASAGEADGSSPAPGFGPLHSERLDDVHRLDVRLSHARRWGAWRLRAEVGVDNLYDRRNHRGYESPRVTTGETLSLEPSLGRGLTPVFRIALER